MDKFLRGDDGLPPLLSSDALQAQLDSKVHKNDHAAHADTLSTHAVTLNTLNTALAGKQDEIVTVNAPLVKSTLGLGSVDDTSDLDKPISNAANVVHTSLEARLGVLEGLLQVTYSNSDADILFTQSMAQAGTHIQLYNPLSQTYLIKTNTFWGLRSINEGLNVSPIVGATTPNHNAVSPDDSVFIVKEYGDGMSCLQSSLTPEWQLGNGATITTNETHSLNGHPMANAGEVRPDAGMVFVKVNGTVDKYHVSFPAFDLEAQYLVNEYLGNVQFDNGHYPHICRVSKLGDYAWDVQSALPAAVYPTRLSKALALATWQLIVVQPPVVIVDSAS